MQRALVAFVTVGALFFSTSAASAAVTHYKVSLAADGGATRGSGAFTFDDASHEFSGTVTHTLADATSSSLATTSRTIQSFGGASPISVAAALAAQDETDLAAGDVIFVVQSNDTSVEGAIVVDEDAGAPDAGSSATTDAGKGPTTTPTPNPKGVDASAEEPSSSGSSGDGGCNAAPTSRTESLAGMTLVGFVAALFVRRARRRAR